MMEKCSIIIPAYNEAQNIKKCLESVTRLNYPKENYEIIVVDNNSTDGTEEVIGRFKQVVYLQEAQKGGAFARNTGIRSAKHGILVFLDADTNVSENWLTKLLEPFRDKDIGAVGGKIRPLAKGNAISEYLSISLFMRYPRYGKRREMKGYPSCNLAVRKELLDQGFDTAIFDTYGEDKDICYRILNKGFKVIFQPEAVIYHRHPVNLIGFFKLLINGSSGRVNFSKKYPAAPDAIFFNSHIPLVYTTVVLFAFFSRNTPFFLILISPAAVYFLFSATDSFIKNRNFLLSFLIKPFLDTLSVYIIYISYHFYKATKGSGR